ncbi:MAG TPA: sulfotransferase [Tepidisphaeraceae bacterium]|nr:sulfotransferase [Tepidisphaeraceae bacterium]
MLPRPVRHWMYASGLKSAARLTLPDFLGIGAQKSATTWLHENLKAHPGAFVPQGEEKEIHFFDQRVRQWSLERYAELFAAGVGKIKGEITPAYGILPPGRIRFIRAVIPNVRLIFLMRNPIERAWSHALMELTWKVDRPFADVKEPEFYDHFHSPASLMRGDYATILHHWLSVFPRWQVFVGYFEDVVCRPRELLGDIFRHLGLATEVDWPAFPYQKRVYGGSGAAMPERFRQELTDLYRAPIERLARQWPRAEAWLDESPLE